MMSKSKRLYTLAEMQEFNVARIFDLVRKLSVLDGAMLFFKQTGQQAQSQSSSLTFPKTGMEGYISHLNELSSFLLSSDLVVSKGQVDRISDLIKKQCLLSSLTTEYQKLQTIIQIEISQKHFFRLTEAEKALFQPNDDNPLFGFEVQNNFSSTLLEIDEAAKCLALERYAATVFHLMRALEITLIAIRKCFGLPDPEKFSERNWGKILHGLRQDVDRRNKQALTGWTNPEDQQFFSDIIGSVAAVKLAWRDPTMHVEKKYLPHEAQEIFASVRTLMQKVASRMNEEGLPLA
jgi:hypothetical protein